MEQPELVERAQGREFAVAWREPERWQRLVGVASKEPPDRAPVTAALWEAMWRSDPTLAPERWVASGPQPPNGGEPLNPFLPLEVAEDTLAMLAELDAGAAQLLRAAMSAELVPSWWQPSRLAEEYVSLRRESATFIGRVFPQRGRREETLDPSDPDLPPNRIDDYEVALTRLLLVGHRGTTAEILPTVLSALSAGDTTDGTALVEQFRLTEFALRRVPRELRGRTGAAAARRMAFPALPQLTLPRKQNFRQRLPASAAVLAGTVAALRAEPRAGPPVSVE